MHVSIRLVTSSVSAMRAAHSISGSGTAFDQPDTDFNRMPGMSLLLQAEQSNLMSTVLKEGVSSSTSVANTVSQLPLSRRRSILGG